MEGDRESVEMEQVLPHWPVKPTVTRISQYLVVLAGKIMLTLSSFPSFLSESISHYVLRDCVK